MAFLNSRDSVAAAGSGRPGRGGAEAAGEADGAGAQKAEKEPVLNEQQAGAKGPKNVGGEGAPKVDRHLGSRTGIRRPRWSAARPPPPTTISPSCEPDRARRDRARCATLVNAALPAGYRERWPGG